MGEPTVVWAQKGVGEQTLGGAHSWQDARTYFYTALTADTKEVRDVKLTDSFRALGQVMHLVSDMSVPEHTRNNSHIFSTTIEPWLEEVLDPNTKTNLYAKYSSRMSNALNTPIAPDPSLLQQAGLFPGAPIPIANLFDFEKYTGSNPSVTTTAPIGLAEYSNANFFSINTIFEDYNYPAASDVTEFSETDPETGKIWTYIRSPEVNYLAKTHVFYKYLVAGKTKGYTLDNDKVHASYMEKLIPRAVGYAGALVDYFYRGAIELSLPAQGVYATAAPGGAFNEIRVRAKNTTATGEEMTIGSFQLVVKYNLSLADPFQSILVDLGPETYISVPEKNSVAAISKTSPTELVFDLSSAPLPTWAANVSIQVVFKGILGNELNAVAVGYSDISEPTPVDVYNNTDYSCLNSTWYRYDDPSAMAIVDSNHDGIADRSDIYRHTITNISFLGGPANAGTLNAATSNNLFAAGPLQPGQLLRMGYILTDYENRYAINENRTGLGGDPYTHATVNNNNFSGTAFQNDWDTQDSMFSFRGQNMWWGSGVIFINTEYNGTCTWDALNQKLGY